LRYPLAQGAPPGSHATEAGTEPGAAESVAKLRMCDLKEDLNAEDAEVFAKARREAPYFAYLCENLCALCV
jgi:hypothetical protein